ncbi:MAG: exo-beta-N-acetylmuramidase NamZ domain-containing protein [Mangrovibacterium sp.]
MKYILFFLCLSLSCTHAKQSQQLNQNSIEPAVTSLKVGAERGGLYLNALKGKRVGLVANQTSRVDSLHLLDFLLANHIQVVKIFTPEHGFRGDADAGELVNNHEDEQTRLPIISLYGKSKKPTAAQFEGIDALVFDMQDVGARFYTYYCTLFYVMQTCAEANKPLWVLDRPNPNGDYVAGPILDMSCKSFVGLLPIPVVHGCTLGELARMINGEGWLGASKHCDLTVIPVKNYTHQTPYSLPIKPSPNLPNDISIRLYPSLCFFEATTMSVGRGTDFPFQVVGYPDSCMGRFMFTPHSIIGMDKNPKQKDKLCYGTDYRSEPLSYRFSLEPFIAYYHKFDKLSDFVDRENWFQLLIGNRTTLKQIAAGYSWEELESLWKGELQTYLQMRKKYLLYPDTFELP